VTPSLTTNVAVGAAAPSSVAQPPPPDVPSRRARLLRELGAFGVVGLLAFVVDVGSFNVARQLLDLGPLTAKTSSVVLATTVAYAGNRQWTFRDRRRTGAARQYALFFMLNGVGLLIALACLGFTYYVLGLRGPLAENLSANGVGLVLGSAFRFWSYRRWVFRSR
jgi:putative flippase GtrA